ncbi:hypothetical protein OAL97_05210, partial [Paracoccaceae bacterium]|nr:hypothetical protein [Paracoccaceae bacterium]
YSNKKRNFENELLKAEIAKADQLIHSMKFCYQTSRSNRWLFYCSANSCNFASSHHSIPCF